ncbi:hypothetical protein PSH55_07195 [Pseudoalteromonas sp. Angola-31]|uniref:hypothetical protein n=1 Tax=Pseudoalteromonas sp. P1-7a TaxID=1723755 RepID=UPI0006D67B08|nr:hypothetical protein [Pseudoalteromonas sp. P1-7a]KPZ60380.1 hypothetical protein AN389_02478 [Pseudoalteromonas sp. P1-7a]MDC9520906.1 hypothetical protein [Pseudoalteromonas sp. Angola-31]
MDIDQSIKIIEQQNRKLFSATHTWLIVIGITAIALILTLTIPSIPAALITGISAFFVLYHYVAHAIKNINARITLMETRNKTK